MVNLPVETGVFVTVILQLRRDNSNPGDPLSARIPPPHHMGNNDMKLYGSYTSPFVRHCRVALAQEGLAFDFIETDYAMSAEMSPTCKVPFLEDGETRLTDSTSIVRLAREKAGKSFLDDLDDFELYCMTNTILDATINLFLLDNDGFGPDQIPYLGRQQQRILSGIGELNNRINPSTGIDTDSHLRFACYIDWAIFRNRVDFNGLDNLNGLLETANQQKEFAETAPPRS
jgi:glutathione S-transferase